MTAPSPHASRDSQLQYREKLTPGVGMWLMVLLAGVATFFVGAPISITAGVYCGHCGGTSLWHYFVHVLTRH